jgi:acyl carrier protein
MAVFPGARDNRGTAVCPVYSEEEFMIKLFKKKKDEEDDLTRQVKELIAEHFRVDVKTLSRKTDLRKDLSVDSIDILEAVVLLEVKLGKKIPENQLNRMVTIGDIVDFVKEEKEAA